MTRFAFIVLATTVLAMLSSASEAQAQRRGTRPAYIVPLTAGQGAALNAEIDRLSRRLGIRQTALDAIADILGANLRNVRFDELIRRVQAQAERAAELQSRLLGLEQQLAALTDTAVRSPAERALARATQAFNEGRLEDAEREFATLETLRDSESETARTAWFEAVEARSRIAELRLDFDLAEQIRTSAVRAERRLSDLSTHRQWTLLVEASLSRYQQGDLVGDNRALLRAVALLEEALPLVPRALRPIDWASTQNLLGITRYRLGARQPASGHLEGAIEAYRNTSQVWDRDGSPREWALVQVNLGIVLAAQGRREGLTSKFLEAEAVLRSALEVALRANGPMEIANTQMNLAIVLIDLGAREARADRFRRAITLFDQSLANIDRSQAGHSWAAIQINLGNAHYRLGFMENLRGNMVAAEQAYRSALEVYSRDIAPSVWGDTQENLGNVLRELGVLDRSPAKLQEAVAAFHFALQARQPGDRGLDWANLQNSLGNALERLGQLENNPARLTEAVQVLEEAVRHLDRNASFEQWAGTALSLALARGSLAQRTGNRTMLAAAMDMAAETRATVSRTDNRTLQLWANMVHERLRRMTLP